MAHKKLQGQVAIVTGGGRGIGEAVALQLAALGAAVVVSARSEEQVARVAARIREQGGAAHSLTCDIADANRVKEVVAATMEQWGRIDILVNNAGVIWPVEDVIETDPDEWTYSIQVNLLGSFYFVREVLPVMVAQQYGRIVNVSSGAAINPIVGASAYSVSKAGMDMLSRAVAQELPDTGITINSFHPGMVDTEMQVDLRSVDTSDAHFDLTRFHDAHAQGALRAPQVVAQGVTWLAGPWARERSGEVFKITDEAWMRQVEADLALAS
jgi:NAD(P)-dependent dehydrogenase (short-subunit alcohol dehydrogenase family)